MKPSQKIFAKYFIISLLVAIVSLTLLGSLAKEVSEKKIFGETETDLMEDMPTLVDEDSIFFEAFRDKKRVNVLLLGFNDNLSDTMMVVSFDYEAKHVDIISIPRDTYYFRKGYHNPGSLKINAIYQRTWEPLETAIAVSDILLGMPLHYYAIIDYDGVRDVVDTMGGVPMNIPFHMKYRDPTDRPPLVIDIPAGEQILDGDHAVQFLRYRKGYREGDIGRVKAQQDFMRSAFKQAIGFDLPKIAKVVMDNVESDLDIGTVLKILARAPGIKGEDISTYLMPNTLQSVAPYYVYPDSKGISEVIQEIYSIEAEEEDDESEDNEETEEN